MKLFRALCVSGPLCLALGSLLYPIAPAATDPRQTVTQSTVETWMTELSNWGRWGKDDQIGTMNLITPALRKQAAALVHEGFSVSLARNAETVKALDNENPFIHEMTSTGASHKIPYSLDTYSVNYHGWAHTHMDAVSHMFYKGKMYNGFSELEVTKEGAQKLAILKLKNGIFTRGVLMDIPRLKGIPYLQPGTPIYPEDLEAWEKKANVHVTSGDVILIRTGRWALRDEKGAWDISKNSAGLYASCAKWLKSRDVAIVGSDAASDLMPSGVPGVEQPIHQLVLIAMGAPIFDNCDLEALSDAASKRKRWTFLITAAPLAVPGGTGSPLNPIATF